MNNNSVIIANSYAMSILSYLLRWSIIAFGINLGDEKTTLIGVSSILLSCLFIACAVKVTEYNVMNKSAPKHLLKMTISLDIMFWFASSITLISGYFNA